MTIIAPVLCARIVRIAISKIVEILHAHWVNVIIPIMYDTRICFKRLGWKGRVYRYTLAVKKGVRRRRGKYDRQEAHRKKSDSP